MMKVRACKTAVSAGFFAMVMFCAQLFATQASGELYFTNKIATFSSLDGQSYLAAQLVEADSSRIIFKTNGVFEAVAFTNLSPETLDQIGITQDYLASLKQSAANRAVALAKERTMLVDEEQRLRDGIGLLNLRVNTVEVSDNDPVYGNLRFCRVTLPSGVNTAVFVARLPDSVPEYFQRRDTLTRQIADLNSRIDATTAQVAAQSAQIDQAQNQVNQANAVPRQPAMVYDPYNQVVVNASDAVQNQINQEQANINSARVSVNDARDQIGAWRNDLTAAQGELNDLMHKEKTDTTVQVVLSHYLHNKYQIMVCAPQPEPEENGN
jgi:hypothetical protein